MSLNGTSELIDFGNLDLNIDTELSEADINAILEFSEDDISVIAEGFNQSLEHNPITINETPPVDISSSILSNGASAPYNPFYTVSSVAAMTVNPFELHLPFEETQNDVNSTTKHPVPSASPLTFQYEKPKRRKRHSHSPNDLSLSPAAKCIEAENEIDNQILTFIVFRKNKHFAVNDTVVTNELYIDQATLDASKVRLKEKGYLVKKGKLWHRITQSGKEYVNLLSKDQRFSEEPTLKRNKTSP